MPYKPKTRCSQCKRLHPGTGRCPECRHKQNRELDRARGSAASRGYGAEHTNRFRPGVLEKNPRCVCDQPDHGHPPICLAPATVADHWPLSRRQLQALGLDPNDPFYGRGLCQACHNAETARNQPGGWNRRATP